ncbi:MAG TPA: LamG domain-containing protein [Nitrososphaeraceae archaeon]|nr:LamG domain-containing protein [Nitrososphaeraceae archaeon]
MSKSATTSIGYSLIVVLFLFFGLTIQEQDNYENNILNQIEIFAQEENNISFLKNSKITEFIGINYTDIVNSQDINPNSFTVSVWFNTAMNVTGKIDNAILLNKGGFGSDRSGFNLNYGIWLNNREKVTGGFETSNGDDYFITSQGSYADGVWHNAILTFDDVPNLLNLFIDGVEAATKIINTSTTPDTTGKQPIRLGANSLVEKGIINGNYTGQLDDIQVWDYAFTKEQVANLFKTESTIPR